MQKQIALLREHQLPGTFLLQYDALVDTRYQRLMCDSLPSNCEVGAWWEITQPQVEAAGLVWRGDHPWVSTANIAFSTGYTQVERLQLVDVYMAKFLQVFGCYPRSVGSWYIDSYTLDYMHRRYGVVASCNCKDQVGTDGYTLWGGYWNQAYYPSRLNGYMPAQTADMQVDVPVFRMLGSDPLYQYDSSLGDNGQGVITLEPVYSHSGQNRQWVERYLDCIARQPSLSFNYTQVGQENSFTWEAMAEGLTMQVALIAELARKGDLRVETLETTGRWFRKRFPLTPPTAVTVLQDTYDRGNRTVWYNSRYYRANLWMSREGNLRFRDIHLFDQRMRSSYLDTPGSGSYFEFTTLPFVDGMLWSRRDVRAALCIVRLLEDGGSREVAVDGFQVKESGEELIVRVCEKENGTFSIRLCESDLTVSASGVPYAWALELLVPHNDRLPFVAISPHYVHAIHQRFPYAVRTSRGTFHPVGGDTPFRILPYRDVITLDMKP
ncbi:MAG: hypothetical protein HUK03_08140 [Bacteroidaceae bacterium]|nr:hypothetical protein [Bacteroidaceae bacterium]